MRGNRNGAPVKPELKKIEMNGPTGAPAGYDSKFPGREWRFATIRLPPLAGTKTMTTKDRRRKSRRYSVSWKTAVVFDRADNRPVFHTQTQDLSVGGTAIFSERGDLVGSTVTVLIDRPAGSEGEVARMIKMRAQVVSSVFVRAKSAYRLGLKFLPSSDDALNALAEVLNATEAGGRLGQLKRLAQAKQAEEPKPDPQEEINQRLDTALRKAFAYLKELVENLNVVRPPYPRAYTIAGAPPLDGLAWDSGSVDLRMKERSPTSKLCEQVGLYFRLDGRKQIQVTRENPAHERFRQNLVENKIEFTTRETRNERGTLERTTFTFPCEVNARLILVGDFQTGKIHMMTRHVERFGLLEYQFTPEAITDESLEHLAGFLLGESPTAGPMLTRRT